MDIIPNLAQIKLSGHPDLLSIGMWWVLDPSWFIV